MALTLFDATLDLARITRGVRRFKISICDNVTGKISSDTMANITGEYVGGCVWFMTGEDKGRFSRIASATPNSITLEDGFNGGFVKGDVIMVCPWKDFNLDELIDAINSVLYRYPILAMDNSLSWDSSTMAYPIPADVDDIRRIQIENTNENGTYTISHCWTADRDGFIRFHTAQGLYKDKGEMQIYYRKLHGEIYEDTDAIDPSVDETYLRNMAFLWLWRNILINQHKDNPIAADMYNEAKTYEQSMGKLNMPERKIIIRDFFTR